MSELRKSGSVCIIKDKCVYIHAIEVRSVTAFTSVSHGTKVGLGGGAVTVLAVSDFPEKPWPLVPKARTGSFHEEN